MNVILFRIEFAIPCFLFPDPHFPEPGIVYFMQRVHRSPGARASCSARTAASVELLEGILQRNHSSGASSFSSSSFATPSSIPMAELASPPRSVPDIATSDNYNDSKGSKLASSCSLWLGEYEISGKEKVSFLKHLVGTSLRELAGTVRQLHESIDQYHHRPSFRVGTSMIVEIYRHVQSIIKELDQ
jgi:hypothetical protein